ncbi:MAG: hypothetical protein IPO58_26680 [Betaproteobacteria bacterium]|nr:hypothetical protein [Betaproteobacteria bacterium]
MLKSQTGIDALGVNYPGTTQAATDLAAGRLDFMITDLWAPSSPSCGAGGGPASSASRRNKGSLPIRMSAPLAESGLPGYEYASLGRRFSSSWHAAWDAPDEPGVRQGTGGSRD